MMYTHLTFQRAQSKAQYGLHLLHRLACSLCVRPTPFLLSFYVFVYMYECLMILIVFE